MAKDPAMLWYWSDWNSGTGLLSRFIKGCYMDLLHAQFNNGRLSLEEIKICLGSDFGTSWPTLQKKFEQDEAGLFFNVRLEQEKVKRENFSKKQSINGKNGGRPPNKPKINPTLKPNESLLENTNENVNDFKREGVVGEGELWSEIKKNFYNDFNWKEKFCRDKNLLMPALENFQKEFINDRELKEDLKDLKELKNHFTNWYNKKQNGSTTFNNSNKPGTSEARVSALKNW